MSNGPVSPPIRVAVIGGGIAGLTTAWNLVRRGYTVKVYDERIHLGGKLGAHPGRLSLRPPKGANIVMPQSLDVRTGRISASDYDELVSELKSKKVPCWLQVLMASSLERRIKAADLNLEMTTEAAGRKVQDAAEGGDGGATAEGSEEATVAQGVDIDVSDVKVDKRLGTWTWTITVTDSKRTTCKAQFAISLYRRVDDDWVVELTDGTYHEHCFHMYLNWYRNFWELMEQIGLERSTHFECRHRYLHVFPGRTSLKGRTKTLAKVGSIEAWASNIVSGVASSSDMFLWLYSVLDLIAADVDPARYLDRLSVHGYLANRGYASEAAMRLHETLLMRAFAVPTYYTSLYSYRKLLAFLLADPEPMLWVLKGNSDEKLFEVFEGKLKGAGVEIQRGCRVSGFRWSKQGRVEGIRFCPADVRWPREPDDGEGSRPPPDAPELDDDFDPDYVVVAIPPGALADAVSAFRGAMPRLSRVRKLQTGVTAALDLHFTVALEGVPDDHMILRKSRYGLTVINNSRLWGQKPASGAEPRTCLNVSVTDYYKIAGMGKREAIREILDDLRQFIPFEDHQVDFSKTYLQFNENEPLFLNEVGSETWRPTTITEVPNLFLAGDYVANDIDIVCVEGAVASGLMAARAVQAQLRQDRPDLGKNADEARLFEDIPVRTPESLSRANAEALKSLVAGYLAPAQLASRVHELRTEPARAFSPREARAAYTNAIHAPARMAADAAAMQTAAFQWWVDLPVRGPEP